MAKARKAPRHVWIVGGAAEEKYFDPMHGAEVWALTPAIPTWLRRPTRMFNLHRWDLLVEYKYDVVRDRMLCEKHPQAKHYVIDPWPKGWLPNETIFPRASVFVPFAHNNYHCSSFDWLVALAMSEKFERITLQGARMRESGEPISAQACLEYWCGIATGRGIDVRAAPDSDLFYYYHRVRSNLVYSYDDTPLIEEWVEPGREGFDWGNHVRRRAQPR